MRIAAQKINNRGIDVSRSKLMKVTEKYVKQIGQANEKLYDLGYLPNPQYFDEDAVFECLFEEYPEFVSLCRNVTTGAIVLSDNQLQYMLKIIGTAHKAYDVLKTILSATQASQALSDISSFLASVHFKKTSDILNCAPRLAVSGKVYSGGKIPMDSPYVREGFVVPDGKMVVAYNYSIEVLRTLLKNIGCDEPVDLSDASLLLGGDFTIEDDCKFLLQLIRGDIEGNGKYASQLHEAVTKYYSDYYATRTTIAECLKYEEQLFIDATKASIDSVNSFRAMHPDYEEFFVDSECVYWLTDKVSAEAVADVRSIYIGEDIVGVGTTGVSIMNRLLGFSGEFLFMYDEEVPLYEVTGMPVILYSIHNGKPLPFEYYPAVNLRKKIKDSTVPMLGNPKYVRKLKSVEDVLSELEIESIESLASEVADILDIRYKVNPDGFKMLVGLLVQSLVCVMCDYTLDGRDSPNHVLLGSEYSWVTEEIYLDACAAAETFFLKLGL